HLTLDGPGAPLWQQAHHRQRRHALAAARFAYQAQDLATPKVKAHAVDRLHHTAAQEEIGMEVADFQDRRPAHSWRSLGSRRSRSQSPNRLTDSTRRVMAMPGIRATHQASASRPRPSGTIVPQVGVGGGMPAPRNDNDASAMMTTPMLSVTRT